MNSSNYNNAFPDDSEFIDAETDFDNFDFSLEDDTSIDGDDVRRGLAEAKASSQLDAMLTNSNNSMDFQDFETALENVNFSSIQENAVMNNNRGNSRHSYRPAPTRRQRSNRDRAMSLQPTKEFQLNEVNFNPLPVSRPPTQRHFSQGDLSVASYATTQSAPCFPTNNYTRSYTQPEQYQHNHYQQQPQQQPMPDPDSDYNVSLNKLAASMKQSAESRLVVDMMKRKCLTPAQRAALSTAKEHLKEQLRHQQEFQKQAQYYHEQQQVQQQALHQVQQQAQQVQQQQMQVVPPSPQEVSSRSSIMTAFFSGSRGTLTNGLEQSRRQLSMYMSQVNHQTF